MLPCCKAEKHGWERFDVERSWLPAMLRCLIVGENPGGLSAEYFYERPASYESDKVDVRKGLLRGLREQHLIGEPTLEGFRDAGFLFDHATRCRPTQPNSLPVQDSSYLSTLPGARKPRHPRSQKRSRSSVGSAGCLATSSRLRKSLAHANNTTGIVRTVLTPESLQDAQKGCPARPQ